MRIFIAAAAILGAIISSPLRAQEPMKAVELMPFLADLASRSGYGNGHAEVGAFLVRGSDGTVQCQLWNTSAKFQTTSYEGVIPKGTIAIAHTHPRCCRDLSAQDKHEAERLRIPIVAVSMGTMHLVSGDGTPDSIQRGISWSRHRDAALTCSTAGQPVPQTAHAVSR